jgi:hypothetical protein
MPDALDFDTLAASLRASSDDLGGLLEVLAYKFELTLPGRVRVRRRPVRLFAKQKRVESLELSLGDTLYRLERLPQARIAATKRHVVRGVALSTEELDVDAWLRELVHDLGEVARTSETERAALERELLG